MADGRFCAGAHLHTGMETAALFAAKDLRTPVQKGVEYFDLRRAKGRPRTGRK